MGQEPDQTRGANPVVLADQQAKVGTCRRIGASGHQMAHEPEWNLCLRIGKKPQGQADAFKDRRRIDAQFAQQARDHQQKG